MKKPTERFTATVADYIKYRPSYPQEFLRRHCERSEAIQGKNLTWSNGSDQPS